MKNNELAKAYRDFCKKNVSEEYREVVTYDDRAINYVLDKLKQNEMQFAVGFLKYYIKNFKEDIETAKKLLDEIIRVSGSDIEPIYYSDKDGYNYCLLLEKTKYVDNGNIAILIYSINSGFPVLFADMTINNGYLAAENYGYISKDTEASIEIINNYKLGTLFEGYYFLCSFDEKRVDEFIFNPYND